MNMHAVGCVYVFVIIITLDVPLTIVLWRWLIFEFQMNWIELSKGVWVSWIVSRYKERIRFRESRGNFAKHGIMRTRKEKEIEGI